MKVLYLFGYVDYTDQFGQNHRAGYARRYDPNIKKGQNNLVFVTEYGYNYDEPRTKNTFVSDALVPRDPGVTTPA